jgi:hypothetical protein
MLKNVALGAGVIASLILTAGTASATITATVTADNHYSIYRVTGTSGGADTLALVGGNELTFDGAPGLYNWSLPETFTFESQRDVLYLAAWSDDFFAQGLLGQFIGSNGSGSILSGDSRWQVYRTGIDLDDGDAYPAASLMQTQIALANTNSAWTNIAAGGNNSNGTAPWREVPGITQNARWMWANTNGTDFEPGADVGEFLIFCVTIPSPASLALAGMGLAFVGRRSRKA